MKEYNNWNMTKETALPFPELPQDSPEEVKRKLERLNKEEDFL